MSDATPEATVTAPEATPQAPSTSTPPPWGDDFNPETAWDKIQKANREAANLRQRAITPEQQQKLEEYERLEQASKSELQRQAEALEATSRRAESAETTARRLQVAIDNSLGKDDLDLLGSGDEEQMQRIAQRIQELKSAATPAAPAPMPGQRPVEQLRPGATPSAAVSEDDANYARLFGPDAP